MSLPPGHITSAISAVGQGQLTQLRIIVEDIYEKLDEKKQEESSGKEKVSGQLQAIEPAEAPPEDAKSAEVRDYVISLTERFNELLTALKG